MIDDRLSECLTQARACVDDKGGMDEHVAFSLMRRAYAAGYFDAHREMPEDAGARATVLEAWQTTASASRALAWSIANRKRGVPSDRRVD